jgi:hypothetical protein
MSHGPGTTAPGGEARAAAAIGLDDEIVADYSQLPTPVKRLSPLELAAIFAPAGYVPVVICHSGAMILHSCPLDVAMALPASGSA